MQLLRPIRSRVEELRGDEPRVLVGVVPSGEGVGDRLGDARGVVRGQRGPVLVLDVGPVPPPSVALRSPTAVVYRGKSILLGAAHASSPSSSSSGSSTVNSLSQIRQTIGPAARTERATRMRRAGWHPHVAGGLLRLVVVPCPFASALR